MKTSENLILRQTGLKGAFIIELERAEDERGYFARAFCRREFASRGLDFNVAQCNISFNRTRGTLRGMHYQVAPHEEVKVVRCTRGALHDVILDLRPQSDTFRRWMSIELTAENGLMLYVPKGFAHGFQTLEDETEVLYLMSEDYHPESARGVRWDDPAFAIEWPAEERRIISTRDRLHPDFGGSPLLTAPPIPQFRRGVKEQRG